MHSVPITFGKHTTVTAHTGRDAITNDHQVEVYDDEKPGFVHLYVSDGTQRRFARSVCCDNREHFDSVVGAWGISRQLVDMRQDRTIPLPLPPVF